MTNSNDRNRNNNERNARGNQKPEKPWGRVVAVIDPTKANQNPRFVALGAAWLTENGNLKLRLEAAPQQWSDPHYPRTIIVIKNEDNER